MKIKKVLYFILFVFVIILSGCGQDSSPRSFWDDYIKAMNEKDIEKVAALYYTEGSFDYDTFLEKHSEEDYFDFETLSTKSFSSSVNTNRYYVADVTLNIDGSDHDFNVYFVKSLKGPWEFISHVNISSTEIENLGNVPDVAYYNNIVKNNGSFDYKYVYGGQAGVEGPNDYVKIVYPNKNEKIITIPEMIDNVPVTVIGDYAFFDYFRIFSVTFSRSKLEQINLPSGLTRIDEYAFYQTKNLKQIELPSSLREVKTYAFASSGLEKLIINVDDKDAYAALSEKTGRDTLYINGDRVVYTGTDIVSYSVLGYNSADIDWSTSDPSIATMETNGRLKRHAVGKVTIKAALKGDEGENFYATAEVEVKPQEEKTVKSSLPTVPAFSEFRFTINSVYFTGDTISPSLNLPAIWTTSDPNVAVVEGNSIKMVGTGTVKITATVSSNPLGVTEATITVKDSSERNVVTEFSYDNFEFTGARDMFKGDYIKLNAEGFTESQIEWSSSNEEIATVGRYSGLVTAKSTGTVTIRGIRADNPAVISMVTITVSEPVVGVTFADYSLDRLNNLKEIHINSINPYSVTFSRTLKLKEDVVIYVPAQNIETYKAVYSKYANNFRAMP